MSILNRQRRLAEIGRIRMGEKRTSQRGTKYPAALQTWRLTSRVRDRLDAAARIYGGQVRPWEDEPGQYELYTESDALDVILAPGEPVSLWMEHWDKPSPKGRVTCIRRCDGVTEQISDQPCFCENEEKPLCKSTTRLSVILYRVPGLGVWRLDSKGYNASVELAGTAEFLASLGERYPVVLRLDPRESVDAQGETHKFVVPVLDVPVTVQEILAGVAPAGYLSAPPAPALEQPGYQPLPPGDGTTVAGALESVQGDPPARRRTAKPQAEIGPAAPPPAAAPIAVPDDPDDRGTAGGYPAGPKTAEQMSPPSTGPAPGASVKTITEAQVKRLWTIARNKTMPEDEIKRLVHEVTGQDSTRAIPKGELYDAVIAAIEAWDPLDVLPKEGEPAPAGDDEQTGFESIPFGDPAPTPEA